jgi:hypothetical protein
VKRLCPTAIVGVGLAALASASIGAAAGSQWVWPKSWAESQLLKKFPGTTTVCDPVGPPSRTHGYNTYAEFACVVTLSGKSSYVLVIKPRSRAAWTTLRIRKTSSPSSSGIRPVTGGAAARASRPELGSSHTLAETSLDGSHLTLDDGSRWLTSPIGEYQTVLWAVDDAIAVLKGATPGYGYQLVDAQNGTSVPARFLGR